MRDAVIFDVDGTLVDTTYLHAVCWWEAFRQHDRHVPMADVHRAVGMGSDKLLDAVLPDDRDRADDDGMTSAHAVLYAQYHSRLRAFDGAADLLRACHGRGARTVLASSAAEEELRALRAALDADDAIDAATSSSDVKESKPAPDLVEAAVSRAGVDAGQAIFVGDAVWDVKAAARAGMPCVAVLSGGVPRADLEEAGAVAVYADVAALLADLDGSPLNG
ncbi:HAD family hydrolase [Actinomadura parmotrematis]|uniref:HAD family hydrolase n=1 Tax=Actinomadura parmotrematis TaxID=2864039 RepID=A0ABS7FPL9_9ACTN|nr:HAD family hydrolase [Actinomadura parmotrematis]MBW8481719.1 HAD family hydrolase [Actinomadura parmotrematis]